MTKIFVILGGVGDRPCKLLGDKTPLESAKTKNLDKFAIESNCGYVYSVSEQVPPTEEEATVALLGNNPHDHNLKRGPIEAHGCGMSFKKGNLALRTNFATIRENKLIDRRVGRSLTREEALGLAKSLNKNIQLEVPFEFKPTVGHRGVLMLKGNFSDNITNVDPAYKKVGKYGVIVKGEKDRVYECRALDPNKETKVSARLVNEFVKNSYKLLKDHDINVEREENYLLRSNVVIVRDAGISLPSLSRRSGWRAIVGMPLQKGIVKLAGMKLVDFDYPSMDSHDVYDNLFDGLRDTIKVSIEDIKEENSKNYFIHFKEMDIAGQDNKPKEKKKMIELIDKKFFKFLRKLDIELVVCGDYSAPCELKRTSVDPVPLLHFGKGKDDCVERFTEYECLEGKYGKLLGKDVLKSVGF